MGVRPREVVGCICWNNPAEIISPWDSPLSLPTPSLPSQRSTSGLTRHQGWTWTVQASGDTAVTPGLCCHLAELSPWLHFSPSANLHLSLGLDEDEGGGVGEGHLGADGGGTHSQTEGGPDDKLPCPTLCPALQPAPPLSRQTRQAGLGEGVTPVRLRPE